MVTMTDVAKLAGVSTMTVSNVLNDRPHVRAELRQRVLDAVDASGYVMNNAARSLRRGSTGVIGLAVPELDRPYFGQLAARVVARAADLGYRVAIEQTGAAVAGELAAIALSRTLDCDGLILSAVGLGPTRSADSGRRSLSSCSARTPSRASSITWRWPTRTEPGRRPPTSSNAAAAASPGSASTVRRATTATPSGPEVRATARPSHAPTSSPTRACNPSWPP